MVARLPPVSCAALDGSGSAAAVTAWEAGKFVTWASAPPSPLSAGWLADVAAPLGSADEVTVTLVDEALV